MNKGIKPNTAKIALLSVEDILDSHCSLLLFYIRLHINFIEFFMCTGMQKHTIYSDDCTQCNAW